MDAPGSQQGWFAVVVNDEDQYSIWPQDQRPPAGWRRESFVGSRESCLTYIESAWTDMTPRSVRAWLAGQIGSG
jgi:MbtH protein